MLAIIVSSFLLKKLKWKLRVKKLVEGITGLKNSIPLSRSEVSETSW